MKSHSERFVVGRKTEKESLFEPMVKEQGHVSSPGWCCLTPGALALTLSHDQSWVDVKLHVTADHARVFEFTITTLVQGSDLALIRPRAHGLHGGFWRDLSHTYFSSFSLIGPLILFFFYVRSGRLKIHCSGTLTAGTPIENYSSSVDPFWERFSTSFTLCLLA